MSDNPNPKPTLFLHGHSCIQRAGREVEYRIYRVSHTMQNRWVDPNAAEIHQLDIVSMADEENPTTLSSRRFTGGVPVSVLPDGVVTQILKTSNNNPLLGKPALTFTPVEWTAEEIKKPKVD